MLALLGHPEQFARLREDPQSITIAVEELLRYETPIQVSIRGVPEEIEFAGRRVGPKQLLVLLLGAANRDPQQFADPDRLDLTRRPNRHVSFGVGPHGCVGGWMARFGLAMLLEQSSIGKLAFGSRRGSCSGIPVNAADRAYAAGVVRSAAS